jgi:ubiquitin-protein ligase
MPSAEKSLAAMYRDWLKKGYKEYPNLTFVSTNNPLKLYALIYDVTGDSDEYVDGEYVIEITVTKNFPTDPPIFKFLTPNGLYDINVPVCIEIGHFHKSNYIATLKLTGFTLQLISGLIGWKTLGAGINIIKTSIPEKKLLAKNSSEYNKRYNAVVLEELHDTHAYKIMRLLRLSRYSDQVKQKILTKL